MTDPGKAVFLSYASQDQQAAQQLCDALRAAGVEVWFDQNELRGGDAWDQKIRREIRDCALFIPVISANTASRQEGYFRLEWDLADQRTHMLARNRAFIVPVCLDQTPDAGADVPESFQRVQWTRLPAGETLSQFARRIGQLLSGEALSSTTPGRGPARMAPGRLSRGAWIPVALLIAAAAYLLVEKPWTAKPAAAAVFTPPAHSIAVLPFVNMSGDKEQDYFSDGLTEEILNSLAEVKDLQVAARTSAFSFKGTSSDIGAIARKLNVGAVLEGSVRRSGNTVRITTQLINAVSGFHLWSHTYDRDLGDVLKLETEIANAVAKALEVKLLEPMASKIELGGTRNAAAFDAYLRGRKAAQASHDGKERQIAIDAFSEAIALDPNYALAYANRSLVFAQNAIDEFGPAVQENFDKQQADAKKSAELAPELAEAHMALAIFYELALDFSRASEEYERALSLAPGNSRVLQDYSFFAVQMGRAQPAIAAARRSVLLDPLNRSNRINLGTVLYFAREYREALAAYQNALAVDPDSLLVHAGRGFIYLAQGDYENARVSCEIAADRFDSQWCLAIAYDKLGRHPDAEAQLTKLKAATGDEGAYAYSTIYAQWGNSTKALDWLDKALQLRDNGLIQLKADPAFDVLRREPRFQAVLRTLKFPE